MEIQLQSPRGYTDTTSNDEYLKLLRFISGFCEDIIKQESPNISQDSVEKTIRVIAKLVVRIIKHQGGNASFTKEGALDNAHINGIDSDSNLAQQMNWIGNFLESNNNSVGQSDHTSDSIQILEHGGIKLNMNVSHLTDNDINQLRLTIDSVANKLVLVFRSLFRREEDILKHRKEVIQDPLTGISRRAVFEDELMAGFLNSLKRKELGGVIMVDLNGFKSVNDTYGHDAGDAVLRHAANAMVDVLERASGTIRYELDIPGITKDWIVCRLGGDEFVVILGSNFSGSSKAVIESLRHAIASPLPINSGGKEVVIRQGASFGYSNSDPNSSCDSFSTLLKKADHQMYNEKGGIWRSIRALFTGALRK